VDKNIPTLTYPSLVQCKLCPEGYALIVKCQIFYLVTTSSCFPGIAKLPVCRGVDGVLGIARAPEPEGVEGVGGAAKAPFGVELTKVIIVSSSMMLGVGGAIVGGGAAIMLLRLFRAFFFCNAAA